MLYNKVRLGYGKHYFREIRKTFVKLLVFYRPKHFCRKLTGMVLYRIELTCGYLFEKVLYFIKFQKLQSLHIRALPAMQTGDFFCITSLRSSLDMFRK
jgi:hypothetical protein